MSDQAATRGYVVTLRYPWEEWGGAYVAAATPGRAKTILIQVAQDYISEDITYGDIASCRRCPELDGRREGTQAVPEGMTV